MTEVDEMENVEGLGADVSEFIEENEQEMEKSSVQVQASEEAAVAEEMPAAELVETAAVDEESAAEEKVSEGKSEVEKEGMVSDNELLQILNAQNDVLDCMLTQQKKIHDSVRERRWIELENSINNMKAYSDAFVNLDQCRENFVGDNKDLYLAPEVQDVFVSVRTKLSRSKIENSALATYVSSTKEFVDGVIENCVPQSRTRVYGRNGKIVSPSAESVVLDAWV
ncbi:MAG TPA: hypothetical protein DCM57_02000 [Treponema sp.]|nr:hypothetical protein [Treponema sp.]